MKKEQKIVDFIKARGFKDETDLMANGTAEDKEFLQKYKDISALGQDRHDTTEKCLNLINALVDKVNELNGRIDTLEKK